MVITRSARSQAGVQAASPESPGQKNSAKRIQAHLQGRKESPSDDSSTAESQSNRKQSSIPKTGKRVSRTTGSLPEMNKPSTDGETSEAESHVSGISRIVPSTRTRRSKTKSLLDPSQESHSDAVSDAESSCSDMSTFSGVATRRTTRSMQRKLQSQTEEKDTEIISGNVKQIINIPMNPEDSDTRQTSCLQARSLPQINNPDFSNNEICNDFDDDSFHGKSGKKPTVQKCQRLNIREETQASVAPLKEITKQNCEAVMKSLSQTFAVVEIDRWTEERKSTIKTSDFTSSDGGGSDEEECTVIDVSEDMNKERDVHVDCDTKLYKSELNTSQDKDDSVLLLLSSDESQQSENCETEEDTVCFAENSVQRGSLNGDSENKLCDNALFVIDTTPGFSTDKNFYLDEEDKASEVASEEEEEEDGKSEEEPSDQDKNKDDEFSDEDDLLNSTKSKLLKLTSSSIDPGLSIKQLGGLYINFNADKLQSNKKTLTQIKEKKKNEIMQKAIITPDFEKNYCVPPYRESKYHLQKKRRKERQKTAGDGWFGMKAPELTDELKNDLKALKMRAGMDPKRFYKKNDRDGFPKYFQIGTIVDNPADFYHSRIPKKQRKKTIVEELLADSEFRRYNRKKYSEIMAEKAANAAGKKFRKKKKFRN
uniref:Deoxynucleotidyltransferase terminal interacting protein 2 n=1 Tax=Molossus molossus TaxID=27622 RepID=A0A7J8F7Y1_MOLMO|nr:deoxynucleotidyltransferase terminal interacting protein 2 [Molossus molossus]